MDPELNADPDLADSDDDFAAGFAGTNGPTETPGTRDAETEGNTEQQTPPAEPEKPEYVQVTKKDWDEALAKLARIDELRTTQEKSFGTAFGKIGGIERTLKELAEGGPKVDIPDQDIADLKAGGFPEIARALEQIRNLRALPVQAGGLAPEKVDELVQQRIAPAVESVRIRMEDRLLTKDHPDWRQIDADPAFSAWTATLAAEEQQKLAKASEEYDGQTISDFMTRFKATRKAKAPAKAPTPPAPDPSNARRSRMQAAVTPRGNGAPPQADPDDEFEAGFTTG